MSRPPDSKSKPGGKANQTEHGIEGEGADLWRRVTETVKPLKSNRATRSPTSETGAANDYISISKQTRVCKSTDFQRAASTTNRHNIPELNHGTTPGVDRRTNQRLIRGKLPIEGRLDLHGHSKLSAHRALEAFINGSFSAGRRCVMVITGKGLRLESGEVGVLRQAVPQWLNSPSLRPMVLAYSHATPKDGGEGALYVLLKRKR